MMRLTRQWTTRVALLPLVSLWLTAGGCLSLDRDGRGDPYQQALRKELAELIKSYRTCLQKHEEEPQKAKENCGIYRDALHELAAAGERPSIGDILNRLMQKDR